MLVEFNLGDQAWWFNGHHIPVLVSIEGLDINGYVIKCVADGSIVDHIIRSALFLNEKDALEVAYEELMLQIIVNKSILNRLFRLQILIESRLHPTPSGTNEFG